MMKVSSSFEGLVDMPCHLHQSVDISLIVSDCVQKGILTIGMIGTFLSLFLSPPPR